MAVDDGREVTLGFNNRVRAGGDNVKAALNTVGRPAVEPNRIRQIANSSK